MKKSTPIFLSFLVMGIADSMGPLSDAVQKQFELSNMVSTLMPFFVFIAFAVFSIPGGIIAGRIGMKKLLLIGLGLNAIATLIPSIVSPGFAFLLICIFILGVGTTFLQVAGNPIMRDVSSEGNFSKNLSFAQGIKGIGSASSAYLVSGVIAGIAIFSTMGWRAPFPIFFILMAVAFFWINFIKIDENKAEMPPSIGTSISLLKEPVFAFAVLGIFLYIGAEVSVARFLKPVLVGFGFTDDKAALYGPSTFFILITIGRLLGGVILNVINARTCFRISALLGVLAGLLFMFNSNILVIIGVVLAGLGYANIWPMLFSITVEEKPERAAELSGLMCMAIAGGAIIPLIMGQLVDLTGNFTVPFVIPTLCFAYLLVLSMRTGKVKES